MKELFEKVPDRRNSDSDKWRRYQQEGEDILPMWVADMDFPSPPAIIHKLQQRVDHGVFGYSYDLPELIDVIGERLRRLHGWDVSAESIILLPGLVCGLNVVCRAVGREGDAVMVNTPVYPPFLSAPANQSRELQTVELVPTARDGILEYPMQVDRLRAALSPRTRLFILCNPHNPTGRVYSREELEQLAELCLEKEIILCSDEIHCDLLLGGNSHISVSTLSPEIADQTITLLAPSKTFNIPTLGCSVAVVTNPKLRRKVKAAMAGIVPHVGALGQQAALAAYTRCEEWREQLLDYLTENRDYLNSYVRRTLPRLRITEPEATYLSWIDCRDTLEGNPSSFLLREARLALNDGQYFGPGGKGFVRLNFGCPRWRLEEALERLRSALNR